MNEFYNNIEPIIKKLSEVFCVSVDFIEKNLMNYILEYGRYTMIKDSLFFGIIIFLIMVFIVFCAVCEYCDEIELRTIFWIGLFIICFDIFITFFIFILPYLVSPTMYSIEQVMNLIS